MINVYNIANNDKYISINIDIYFFSYGFIKNEKK